MGRGSTRSAPLSIDREGLPIERVLLALGPSLSPLVESSCLGVRPAFICGKRYSGSTSMYINICLRCYSVCLRCSPCVSLATST